MARQPRLSPSVHRTAAEEIQQLQTQLRELRAENARLARLAAFPEQNPNPVVEVDLDGAIRYANPEALRQFPDLVEKGGAHPWLSGWKEEVRAIGHESASASRVVTLAGRSCHQVFVEVPGQTAVRVYAFDVTDRVNAESLAARTRGTFVELVERAPFGIYIVDSDFRVAMMNTGSQERAFRNVRPVVGRDFVEVMRILWPEPVAAEIVARFRHTLDTGESYYSPRFVSPRHDEGIVESYEWELHRMTLPDGRHGVICYYFDSTALRKAEQALRESEHRFRLVLAHSPITVATVDRDLRYTWVYNPAADVRAEELIGERLGRAVSPKDRERLLTAVRHVVSTGDPVEIEVTGTTPQGDRTFKSNAEPLRDADGEIVGAALVSIDITSRKLAEEVLAAAKQRLDAHMDNSPLAVIEFDPEFRITRWSREAERVFGWPAAEVTGRAIPDVRWVHEDDFEAARQVAADMLEGRRPRNVAVHRTYRKDGTVAVCEWYNSAIYHADGRLASILSQVLDITERERAAEELRRANAALAEADRRKNEFIAVLSHELRNPLAPIRYALPLLAEERLGDGGRRATAVIDRQVTQLSRLVDDLLDVSRITSGKIGLQRDHVTLASVLAAAAEAASPAIVAARHTFEIDIPGVPIWLHVDGARVSQAVTNLLNNSAKYTAPGGRIRLEAKAEQGHAVIRVADNGIGIARDALPSVFEMFRQASDRDTAQGGLGIGLTLARQFVEMHGGTIEASSAGQGQGAEFVISLPLAAHAEEPPDDPQAPRPRHAACLKVLVVDDNVDLVDMLAMLVEAAGHEVRKALDGPSAISAALDYRPDVILLDIGMPGMSGVEVATELRRHPEMAATHIVALTGWGQAEDRDRTAAAGFNDHLTKPADPQQIERVLAEAGHRLATPRNA